MKIPKGKSESVNRRRTENTMAKRKRTKGQEEIEDTNGVIRIRNSKKKEQHNGQKKRCKRTKSNLQNIHINYRMSKTNPTENRG